MNVIQLQDGFGINCLQQAEQAKPSPAAGEVLVKLEAASLNYVDLMVIKGLLNLKLPLPYIPVADGAGVVEQVGAEVTAFQVGDRVTTLFIPRWIGDRPTPQTVDFTTRPGLGTVPGQLSEYKLFSSQHLIKTPENLTSIEAATLPIAALTAWNALQYGNLQAGDTVLLHGTGGVSIFALQFAKAQGLRVIITSSSDEKLARTRQLGADFAINYKTTPNWETIVHDFTAGEGVDLVVETVGGKNLQTSIAALRMGGHISIMGLLAELDTSFNTLSLLYKQATIKGMEVGSTADFEAMNQTIAAHDIHPVIDAKFSLDQTQAAFEYLEQGQHFGKVVITI
ncbi:MAG: NAD(P)-dependent alcohol dehydrogenase [Leptolyngbya sp. BL-A-14]